MAERHSATAYPLQWPVGWKRTERHRRQASRYDVTAERAKQELLRELSLMGAQHVVLSTNVELRRDGLPYATRRDPEDPGVAVYWYRNEKTEVIACDHWRTVRENIRGIGLAVAAMRQLERCGASEILDRAFVGFGALPARASVSSWRVELGFDIEARPTHSEIMAAFTARVKTAHPDRGGSTEAFQRVIQARDAALLEVRSL